MHYCKSGDILIVNAFYEDKRDRFFDETGLEPCVGALVADGSGNVVQVPHGDLVMALESSVPPWYSEDRIRCLWNTREVHILRIALDYHDRNFDESTEDN